MIKLFEEFILELKSVEEIPSPSPEYVFWSNGEIFFDMSDQLKIIQMSNVLRFKFEWKKKEIWIFFMDDRSEFRFIHTIQNALKDFIKANLITKKWKLIIADKINTIKSIGGIDVESILKYDSSYSHIIPKLFHGTSDVFLENIKKKGLLSNNYMENKIHNHTSHYRDDSDSKIYLSTDFGVWERYANNSVDINGGKPIIIEFNNVPISMIQSDDDFLNGFGIAKLLASFKGKDIKNDSYIQSLRYSSQIAIKNRLPASMISKIHKV